MVGATEAAAMVGVISTAEATAFTLRISVAGTTWAADPDFRDRLRFTAREAFATH